MKEKIGKIKKRDGRVVDFKKEKIEKAIFKALEDVGRPDFDLAKELGEKVVKRLKEKLSPEEIPEVEQVQDIVEQVLMDEDQAEVAKSYILYRQKRTEIRREKQQILEKEEIDEVDKQFDLNALRVLKSRYLKKDQQGNLIESPKELFERVAVHVTLPSLLYDQKVFQKKGNQQKEEDFDYKKNKVKIGDYVLNQFHLEGLKRTYNRLNKKGQMKVPFSEFLEMVNKGEFDKYQEEIKSYYNLMVERKFLPNTPALANFGDYLGMGSACFVLGIKDSLESIMSALEKAAIIFKSGGGVGYNFSNLRPEGDFIKTTGGKSSGPLSFMSLFDKMTDVVKQGGIRRGASIGILDSNHPDIESFIKSKKGNKALTNFNISVLIKADFWDYLKKKKPYPLKNPRTGEVVKHVDPESLLDLIVYQAWESAEPGVIFEDQLNKYNPFLEKFGPIRATNPCGEVPLYPKSSCNLGSINVWNFARTKNQGKKKEVEFDWEALKKTVRTATKFLDNVIDINRYPLEEIEDWSLKVRKIGLGMMGLGDLLYELGLPYNSKQGRSFMERLMAFINYHSKVTSVELAKERGPFPFYEKSFYPKGKLPFKGKKKWKELKPGGLNWKKLKKDIKEFGIRNAHTTVIAPTGSISMIAGCSSGIEPVYSLVFEKKVTIGSFYYVDPVFEKVMMREGLFDQPLIKEVSKQAGSVQNLPYVPSKLKKVFVTAHDIKAEDHIKALASLQKWTDASLSKTINFPADATVAQMKKAYLLAHKLGCKDLTVFRHKSIQGVLEPGKEKEKKKEKPKKEKEEKLVSLKDVKANGLSIYKEAGVHENEGGLGQSFAQENENKCPKCDTELINVEGCKKCPNCGWAICST